MKKMNIQCFLISLLLLALYSCEDDFEEVTKDEKNNKNVFVETAQEELEAPDRLFKIGKKLENPYTVATMQQAYKNLKSGKAPSALKTLSEEPGIETTDYYVRFLPKNDQEKEILQDSDSLTLFDMPLDYELEEGVAGAYHDPGVPEGEITWQYTVVPVNYQFREIRYELLANLFLQDFDGEDDEPETGSSRMVQNRMDENLWIALENEAFRITGNQEDIDQENPGSQRLFGSSKWYPSGRIQYEDNTTSSPRIVPLPGARVIVKRWFKWKSAITDANGNFRVGKFRSSKVKCAIKWELHEWDIRSGNYGQAWYSFESLNKGNSWNKTIRKNSTPLNWLYASVHRGALEYFYNYHSYGIKKPYDKNWFLKRRLHIGAKHKSGRSHYFTFNKIWWSTPIVVYSSGNNGTVFNSRNLFATTVHELAHVSHWEIGYSTGQYVIDALVDDPFLPESWAVGVEHTITNRVYPSSIVGTTNFPYNLNRQNWTLRRIQTESEGYTPIVIDMIDNDNQSITWDNTRPNDRVFGYTLGQLEDGLPGSLGSWWSWRTRIREMYNNPNEGEPLDYLFREYR